MISEIDVKMNTLHARRPLSVKNARGMRNRYGKAYAMWIRNVATSAVHQMTNWTQRHDHTEKRR